MDREKHLGARPKEEIGREKSRGLRSLVKSKPSGWVSQGADGHLGNTVDSLISGIPPAPMISQASIDRAGPVFLNMQEAQNGPVMSCSEYVTRDVLDSKLDRMLQAITELFGTVNVNNAKQPVLNEALEYPETESDAPPTTIGEPAERDSERTTIPYTRDNINQNDKNDNLARFFRQAMPESESGYKGNPLTLIPTFYNDPADLHECERWLGTFNNISKEQKWTPAMCKHVLESKLGPRARTRYFTGLGNNPHMTIDQRLLGFKRLFTKAPRQQEYSRLFYTCKQGPREPVVDFQQRLEAAIGPLRGTKFKTEAEIEKELLEQFKIGLLHIFELEVDRRDPDTFEKALEIAIRFEQLHAQGNRNARINTVEEEYINVVAPSNGRNKINNRSKLKGDAKNDATQYQSNTYDNEFVPLTNIKKVAKIICGKCGRQGHIANHCKVVATADGDRNQFPGDLN